MQLTSYWLGFILYGIVVTETMNFVYAGYAEVHGPHISYIFLIYRIDLFSSGKRMVFEKQPYTKSVHSIVQASVLC